MTKYDFITETNQVTGQISYYTKKDDVYVEYSISFDKEKAYERFLAIASGISFKPGIEITETIYSTKE